MFHCYICFENVITISGPMLQFRNRIPSIRLKNWDYSQNGYYFVTICTKFKQNYFGKIKNNKMLLNKIGKIAKHFWHQIPNHFQFIKLDTFIIMPNHIHGILIINKHPKQLFENVWTRHGVSKPTKNHNMVLQTKNDMSQRYGVFMRINKNLSQQKQNKFSKPIKNSLPVIIMVWKNWTGIIGEKLRR